MKNSVKIFLAAALILSINFKPSKSEAALAFATSGGWAWVLGITGTSSIIGGLVGYVVEGKGIVTLLAGVALLDANDIASSDQLEISLNQQLAFVSDNGFIKDLAQAYRNQLAMEPENKLDGVTVTNISMETLNELFERSNLHPEEQEMIIDILK